LYISSLLFDIKAFLPVKALGMLIAIKINIFRKKLKTIKER